MLETFYRSLFRIRRTEEEIARIYPTDKIKSPIHLSVGQEAISVGVCEALRKEDVVFGTYRSHALYLAKGGDLKQMIAELYGKATGCCKGKGGSMHLADPSAGVMGTSAIVATAIPQAVGYAYGFKLQQKNKIAATFFGDGATEEGVFYESLNFAALKKLAVLFICENNGYAVHSKQAERQSVLNIAGKVQSFGIPSARIDSSDPFQIYKIAKEAVEKIRSGEGPQFLEFLTYRAKEHVGPTEDSLAHYRLSGEAEIWRSKDPVPLLAVTLNQATRKQIETEVELEIQDAFRFAEESPWPENTELHDDLFAEAGL